MHNIRTFVNKWRHLVSKCFEMLGIVTQDCGDRDSVQDGPEFLHSPPSSSRLSCPRPIHGVANGFHTSVHGCNVFIIAESSLVVIIASTLIRQVLRDHGQRDMDAAWPMLGEINGL